MFSSVNQAPGVIMLEELPPDGSSVMYLDVVVSRPIFRCFKLKPENCLQNTLYLEYVYLECIRIS